MTTLKGTKGDDYLTGTAGADTLKGGKGRDILDGRGGDDTLNGGKGADIFILSADRGFEFITDFKPGRDTIIVEHDTMSKTENVFVNYVDGFVKMVEFKFIFDEEGNQTPDHIEIGAPLAYLDGNPTINTDTDLLYI